jgi:hypothetical protein
VKNKEQFRIKISNMFVAIGNFHHDVDTSWAREIIAQNVTREFVAS